MAVNAADLSLQDSIQRVEKAGSFYANEVKVSTMDTRVMTYLIKMERPTARDITAQCAKTLELPPEVAKYFALWIVGKDLELQLRPKIDIYTMVEQWPLWVEKYTHVVSLKPPYKFQYRREAMLSTQTERKITNVKAVKLLADEARWNVVEGKYIATSDELVQLGGIYLQAQYGDTKRPEGQIAANISEFVPKNQVKALRPVEWESKINEEHTKHIGKSELISHLLYLQFVRQWPFYGCTIFPACKDVPPNGYFEHRKDHLAVGVSTSGIYVVDSDKNKIIFEQDYYHLAWENTPDTLTLEFGDENDPNEQVVITPQASLIDSLASKAVSNLEKAEERLGQMRSAQEANKRTKP